MSYKIVNSTSNAIISVLHVNVFCKLSCRILKVSPPLILSRPSVNPAIYRYKYHMKKDAPFFMDCLMGEIRNDIGKSSQISASQN